MDYSNILLCGSIVFSFPFTYIPGFFKHLWSPENLLNLGAKGGRLRGLREECCWEGFSNFALV
jgi:hypothetical protein